MTKYNLDKNKMDRLASMDADDRSLDTEVKLLRVLTEEFLNNGSNRAALDTVKLLKDLIVAQEGMEIRQKKLLPTTLLNQFITDLCFLIRQVLLDEGLSSEVTSRIIDRLHQRTMQRTNVLLIEDQR